MNTDRRRAISALIAAGLLWGTTVPLSKLALAWLSPGWLTFVRFGLAAAILLVATRSRVRAAFSPATLISGAIGYGGAVVIQNAGIGRTSVSHAALLIGAAPVLIAVIAALWQRAVARPVAWAGFGLSLAGVGLVAGGHGGGATASGDGLVLASLLVSAMFTVAQGRLLRDRDPVAVTAVQFLGAAIAMLPVALVTGGMPAVPGAPGPALATAALAVGGTLLPFTLFAYGQSRVSAEIAGAFVNLEPLVGAVAGVVVFGNPAGPEQLAGGAAILIGIALSSLPLLASGRPAPAPRAPATQAPTLALETPAPRAPATRAPAAQVAALSEPHPAPALAGGSPPIRSPWRRTSTAASFCRKSSGGQSSTCGTASTGRLGGRAVGERAPALRGAGQRQRAPGTIRLVHVGPRRHYVADPVEGRVIQRDRGPLRQVGQLPHGPGPGDHRGHSGMRHGESHGERGQRGAEACGEPGELTGGLELGGVLRNRGIEPAGEQRGPARSQIKAGLSPSRR